MTCIDFVLELDAPNLNGVAQKVGKESDM